MNLYLVTYLWNDPHPIFDYDMIPKRCHKLVYAKERASAGEYVRKLPNVIKIELCEYIGDKDSIEIAP